MTTPPVDRALLDTNVLLAATDEARAEHHAALDMLNAWPASGVALYTSGQVLREYLAVATRPESVNGLGLAPADALANVAAFRDRSTLLAEDARVQARLVQLLQDVDCSGKQVHDANVVATMAVHGVDCLVTINTSDFARFGTYIRVLPLVKPEPEPDAGA